MRRRQPELLFCLLLVTLSGVTPAPAQQAGAMDGASQPLTIYVVDFPPQSADLGDLVGLPALASGVIQLRLLQVPSLAVHRVPVAPACGAQPQPNPGQQQLAPSPALRPTAAPAGDFYIVRGSLAIHLPDIVMDYIVEKCEVGVLKSLFKDTQPFTADRALEELTVAAHAVAFRLEQSVPRTRIVLAFEIDGNSSDQKEVLAEIRRHMEAAITESSDLVVAETGEYKIGGRITFAKRALPLGPLIKWNSLRGEFYVEAGDKNYPLPAMSASRDKLPEFYTQVVGELKRNLSVVALANKRGWADLAGTMETKALLSRGSEMLDSCPKQTRICSDARDAIPVLAAAVAKGTANQEALALLGRAQFLAGEYADAVKSLEQARDSLKRDHDSGRVVSPAIETGVFNLLGDAYLKLNSYDLAVDAYDASLRTERSQPDIYIRKALALRSAGKRLQALQSLLEGLLTAGSSDDAKSLHSSAKGVIHVLGPDEFPEAEHELTVASSRGASVANEYALLISRTQGQILDTAAGPVNVGPALQRALALQPSDPDVQAEIYANLARAQLLGNDFQKADAFLAQAEKLPTDQIDADNREWITRIRARYWFLQQDYDKAFAVAYVAHQIRDTDDGTLVGAMSLLALGQDKEKAAGANGTPAQKQEFRDLYQRSVMLIEPLVTRRYPDADGVLMAANHSLAQDAKTRQQLESLIKNNPKDDSAINALLLVCSQYLFDFDCAFSAAKMDVALHDPSAPDAAETYVNLAEAAILVGRDDQTQTWLSIALNQPHIAPRDKALAYLYRLWLDMRQARTDQFLTDFHSWQRATEDFRQGKDDLNWLFLGARTVLGTSNITKTRKDLLTAMMDALEDRGRPLPTWPESTAR